ncbi:bifunctional 2',3'-cyclic-nucleotide 2'-phosphodiesterase/3'-nucleotidase [Aureimonas frigidaquae]|uniref:Bifunctional 2',3'-cyclic nucleotide 2'-phosphodiesterase/3'-nucleotidase periplasmic protein n=1 Tax=Aureimonas frigidaquae TaxID=424757 RepID=A0A0P0Z2F4_9HYPH|nr:bifunctional 2',3'-cyclic-nucleotide 2'-phosphodiesterase/3'-nucleotidase [Aureimonas frigidaquae]BAT28268.1 bifunctional 2',3'-cyclic nucleotide 2'-phosphodiesterase/3'-nucleotidase periplasmic protein [Aureimonas frigidaquae]
MHPRSATASTSHAQLRILATSDLHAFVQPYDYFTDQPSQSVGLAQTAGLIKAARDEAPNSLLFDNGDWLQGCPTGDRAVRQRHRGAERTHPCIRAMNILSYDAATLGNHEFDDGLDTVLHAIGQARFPFVCANLTRTKRPGDDAAPSAIVPPFVLLDRTLRMDDGSSRPLRIGVVGVLPPQVTTWNARVLNGSVSCRDMVEALRDMLPELRARGADLIVVLAHTGIEPTDPQGRSGRENAALEIARLDGIDVLITGHQHLRLPGADFSGIAGVDAQAGRLHGVPAVMPGCYGSDLGIVDLTLAHDPTGWSTLRSHASLRPISRRQDGRTVPLVTGDTRILDALAEDHRDTLAFMRQPIGRVDKPLRSYFALVTNVAPVQLINRAQRDHARRLIAGTRFEGLPILSAAAPFKAGGRGGPLFYTDICEGALALRNVADIYAYPNRLDIVELSGEELVEWLEMSASLFNRVAPDRPGPLLRAGAATYNFDVVDGATYAIDLTEPPRYDAEGCLLSPAHRRIVDLIIDGRPLDPAERLLVATNSFRSCGGGHFPGLSPERIALSTADETRDILSAWLSAQSCVDASIRPGWSFAPTGGAQVLFETGTAALPYLADIAHLSPEPLGTTANGFLKLRLTLP